MARVLKKTSSFYCDWHAGHYVKVMLDQHGREGRIFETWRKRTALRLDLESPSRLRERPNRNKTLDSRTGSFLGRTR